MYMQAFSEQLYFYDLEYGWFYTSYSLFPILYAFDFGEWWFFDSESSNPEQRWFYSFEQERWLGTIEPVNQLAYTKLTNFDFTEDYFFATNEDGSRLVFANGEKKIFTMHGDGSNLVEIFDYADFRPGSRFTTPYVDITQDGSKVIWTDTRDEIFIANFDGSSRLRIATTFDNPFGGNSGPEIRTKPRLNSDGSKVYFTSTVGGGQSWAQRAGLYEINADGTGLIQLFNWVDVEVEIFGSDGSSFPGATAFSSFDVSDDGSRFIVSVDFEDGATFTWDRSAFRVLSNTKGSGPESVAISGDGSQVAYSGRYLGDFLYEVVGNRFEGGAATVIGSGQTVQSIDINTDGTLVAIGTGGLETQYTGFLTDPSGSFILSLSPHAGSSNLGYANLNIAQVAISGDGRHIFAPSYLLDTNRQFWRIDLAPTPEEIADFPQIRNVTFTPTQIPVDQTEATVITAEVAAGANPVSDVRFDGVLDGMQLPDGIGGFSDRSNRRDRLTDDGMVNDLVADDGVYTSGDIRPFRNLAPGTYGMRIMAAGSDRIISQDYLGLVVFE